MQTMVKTMPKLYAKHIDTGAWHQVLDVVDSKIPAHMPGGGNLYHLEGHKAPVHQDKIEDLAHEGDDHLVKADTHKYEKKVTDPDTGRERTVKYGHKDYKIAPSTKKGDAYCSRSMGQMKDWPKAAKDPNSPLRLSRKKWKCSGSKSLRKSFHPSQDKILTDNQESTQKVKMPSLEVEHPDYEKWQKIAKSPGMANHLTANQKEESAHGLSPKVIHTDNESEPNQKYMIKPYFAKPAKDESSRHDLPIKGWATATTRDLFDAADIPYLCENVHVSEHNGQPVTVHKFGTGMPYPLTTDHKVNHHQHNRNINKIAMLDYLTGNEDRHGGNILNGLYSESEKRMPMAIDHDRNFRYIDRNNGIDRSKVRSHGYGFKNRIINAEPDGTASSDAQFILNNHKNLAETFNKKLEEINDPHLKAHLSKNFHGRLDHLKDWANQDTLHRYLNDEDTFRDDSHVANLTKDYK